MGYYINPLIAVLFGVVIFKKKATVSQDTETVAEILHDIHNSEIPILQYWKSGKGFADFTFHPRNKADAPFILEFKKDDNVDSEIKRMKKKEYFPKFIKEHENNMRK